MRPTSPAFLALFLLACGGASTAPIGSSPTESATGSSDAAPPGTPGADGGASDDAASDGGSDAGPVDTRIDPIEVGHAWTYDVNVLGFYPACETGTFVATTLGKRDLGGKSARDVQSLCKNAGVYSYSVDGDRVYAYVAGAWHVSLDAPVQADHTWSDGLLTYKWESKGTVTIPAGTFSDCWSATTVASYESYILLCRGVGPIHWHYDDGLGNGYDAVMTAKNF